LQHICIETEKETKRESIISE